jgi:PelA/Pel-15E family pectate lyase
MFRPLLFFVMQLGVALVVSPSPASGDTVTLSRINDLPLAEQSKWRQYLVRSAASAEVDANALRAEIQAAGLVEALRAPNGGDFKLPAKAGDAWYAAEEARQLADVIRSYQTPSGGWSKHTGYGAGPRKPGMQWTSQNEPGQKPHYLATFDNGSTTEQLNFLANVWQATKRADCQAAFVKGLDFVLAAQFPNGGWPQVYPLEGGYHDDITFNDDAMTHILELLQAIADREPQFAFLNDVQRQKAADALLLGVHCVLATQVVQNGKRSVWCAQHDALTLQPSRARQLEPPTLSGLESAHILRFLMSVPNPPAELRQSVEDGLSWLESAKITGLGQTKIDGKTAYVPDPTSTEVYWARFYELKTGRPVFPGRNGVLYDSFAAMAAENKVGYDYYTTLPGSIVTTGQKKWRSKLQ